MHSAAVAQPTPRPVSKRIRLLAPPLADSHKPSSEVTVKVVPAVQRKLPPLQTALTVPPVAGFNVPKSSVDAASITAHTLSTLALTATTCVPAPCACPATTIAAPTNAPLQIRLRRIAMARLLSLQSIMDAMNPLATQIC